MTQPTLFSSDHPTTKTRPPDLFAIAAQKLHNMPVDWVPLRYEIKESPYGKFYEITGAVPFRYLTKGKNKGKPVWPPRKDCEVFRFTPEQKNRQGLPGRLKPATAPPVAGMVKSGWAGAKLMAIAIASAAVVVALARRHSAPRDMPFICCFF
jgi:hypothetical protein